MRRLTLIFIALALVIAACSGDNTDSSPSTTEPGTASTLPTVNRPDRPITGALANQSLVRFDQCDSFLEYVIEHALERVGPYGLQGGGFGFPVPMPGVMFEGDVAIAMEESMAASDGAPVPAAAPAPDRVQGVDFSGTNVQEIGVDEPDIVKTDGNRIIALSEQTLFVVDVTGDGPTLLGKVSLQDVSVREIFLYEDRILALGSGYGPCTTAASASPLTVTTRRRSPRSSRSTSPTAIPS